MLVYQILVGRLGRAIVDWGAVGAIAELIGGAGVIASLVYLAIQIRQNTRTEKTRAFQDVFSSYNAHNHEMWK